MSHDNAIPWDKRKYVRVRDVAEYTGMSVHTVYKAIQSGDLPASKIGSKAVFIEPKDVDAWIESRRAPVTPTK